MLHNALKPYIIVTTILKSTICTFYFVTGVDDAISRIQLRVQSPGIMLPYNMSLITQSPQNEQID
jgi:hypothetical protein